MNTSFKDESLRVSEAQFSTLNVLEGIRKGFHKMFIVTNSLYTLTVCFYGEVSSGLITQTQTGEKHQQIYLKGIFTTFDGDEE